MTSARSIRLKPLIAGNWKMNGMRRSAAELCRIISELKENPPACEVLICPPALLIAEFADLAEGSNVRIGAQDCHWLDSGPYTGDIAAKMLKDAGAEAVIVGHSERRKNHRENVGRVWDKAQAAHDAGLTPIVCIGESASPHREERSELVQKRTERKLRNQLKGFRDISDSCALQTILAYEPVWAIGSGRTPEPDTIASIHGYIRHLLRQWLRELRQERGPPRILYGGSASAANAADLMAIPDVKGLLVGGASLKSRDFLAIIRACGQKT